MRNVAKTAPREANLTVLANATALYVSLESAAVIGRFAPNAMLVLPGESGQVHFLARHDDDFDVEAFAKGVRARSLRDTY